MDTGEEGQLELFLPNIMTKFTDEEREVLFKNVRGKITNGKWTANHTSKSRPHVSLTTAKTREEARAGTRKRTASCRRGNWTYAEPTSLVLAAHAVLVMNGHFPREDDQASHLCHNPWCVRLEHLIWENAGYNMRRKRCQARNKCVCRLNPPCLMKCSP